MNSAFDRALESRALNSAAEEFALQHGDRGTPEYRSAWVHFRRQVRTRDDLRGWWSSAGSIQEAPSDDAKQDGIVREILDAAIERAMKIDGATKATAQFLEPRSQALRLISQQGFSGEFLDFFKIVNDSTSACGTALQRGAPVLITDVTRSRVFVGTAALQVMLRAGSRAVASIPVPTPQGEVIAMISTHHPRTTTWTVGRLSVLRELCGSVGLLLHHLLQNAGVDGSGTEPRSGLGAASGLRQ